MSEVTTIPTMELMKKAGQWLLSQGYRKSTLGVYKATWPRFLFYSKSPLYNQKIAEQFLLQLYEFWC